MQLSRCEANKLTWAAGLGEWGLCGCAGFMVHQFAITEFTTMGSVWTASVATGCAGSKAIEMYVNKFIRHD